MVTKNISYKKFKELKKLELDKSIISTEGTLFFVDDKDKWKARQEEELNCLIKLIQENKKTENDWFTIQCSPDGLKFFIVFNYSFHFNLSYFSDGPESARRWSNISLIHLITTSRFIYPLNIISNFCMSVDSIIISICITWNCYPRVGRENHKNVPWRENLPDRSFQTSLASK